MSKFTGEELQVMSQEERAHAFSTMRITVKDLLDDPLLSSLFHQHFGTHQQAVDEEAAREDASYEKLGDELDRHPISSPRQTSPRTDEQSDFHDALGDLIERHPVHWPGMIRRG